MKLSMYRCDVYIGRIWIKLDWDCGAMLDALDSGGIEMEMGKWKMEEDGYTFVTP